MATDTLIKKKPGDPGYDPLVDGEANLFSGLKTGGEGYLDSAYKTIGDQVSGEGYQPYRTSANQALSRAATNLRASTGSQFAPNIGQGSAVRAQQATEQNILSKVSDTQLGLAEGEQAMKNTGVSNLINMRSQLQGEQGQVFNQNLATKQNDQGEAWKQYESALSAGDFTTAAGKYKAMTGIDLDTTQLKTAQDALNKKTNQELASGELTLGTQKYNDIQNMVNTGATIDQINGRFGANTLTAAQYANMRGASQTSLQQRAIDVNKYSIDQNVQIAKSELGLKYATLAEQKSEWKDTRDLKTAEQKLAGDAFYGYDTKGANGTVVHHLGSSELAADELNIKKQGLSLEEAALKGYKDASGNHVAGSLETAAADLGLKAKTVKAQTDEAYANIANMTTDQQNKVKQLYGYTDPTTGQHIAGSMELSEKQVNGTLENQRLQINNEIAQTTNAKSVADRSLAIQESSAESDKYWNAAKKLSSYVATHLDATASDPQVIASATEWYKQQFGVAPDVKSDQFKQFVDSELKAAQDGRLTNPIDQTIYQINSSKALDDTTKKTMVALVQQIPPETKIKTDENGNVTIDDGSNAWNPEVTFDATNTNPSHQSMFAKAGGVWTGEGQQQFLVPGQKITLGTNFGIEDQNITVPKGNYSVISAPDINGLSRKLLQSEDGTKFYSTEAVIQGDWFPGYKYNSAGGYYTKASLPSRPTPPE
jgi:hypothetical protein